MYGSNSEDGRMATRELIHQCYDELKALAKLSLRGEPAGDSISPTGMVNELFLRIEPALGEPIKWENRRHFLNSAAVIMEHILIDRARRRQAIKRGGGIEFVQLDEMNLISRLTDEDCDLVHDALELLYVEDPLAMQVVQLRYLYCLTIPDVAAELGITVAQADYRRRKGLSRLREIIHAS